MHFSREKVNKIKIQRGKLSALDFLLRNSAIKNRNNIFAKYAETFPVGKITKQF